MYRVLCVGEKKPRVIYSPFEPIHGTILTLDDKETPFVVDMTPDPENPIAYLSALRNVPESDPSLARFHEDIEAARASDDMQPYPCALAWALRGAGRGSPKVISRAFEEAFGQGETRNNLAQNPIFLLYYGLPINVLDAMNIIPETHRSWAQMVAELVKHTYNGNTVLPGSFDAWQDPNLLVTQQPSGIQLRRIGEAEERIAKNIQKNETTHVPLPHLNTQRLDDQQRSVFENIGQYRISLLVGGPGTGKTFTMRSIVEHWPHDVILAASTAAAADVLTRATGRQATTVHRMLKMTRNTGSARAPEPNPNTLIIIDEASMTDTTTMAALLDWIPWHTRLLLVGDNMQLPSVGAGDILRDLQAVLPKVVLTKQYRASSDMSTVYDRLREGVLPEPNGPATEEDIFEAIAEMRKTHPIEDILVLSPQHEGRLGVKYLNTQLQVAFQPPKRILLSTGVGCGDVIVLKKNINNLNLFNGQRFVVESVGVLPNGSQWMQIHNVRTKEAFVFSGSDIGLFHLGYASTIHSAQGLQAPAVVVAIPDHVRQVEFRALLTAITRAQEQTQIFGDISKVENPSRQTTLVERYLALQAARLQLESTQQPVLS